jgi:hypothetical protein
MSAAGLTKGRVCIVEEVPGGPEHEQFYIRGVDHLASEAPYESSGYPCFSTKMDAEMFLAAHGILDFDVEWFEP